MKKRFFFPILFGVLVLFVLSTNLAPVRSKPSVQATFSPAPTSLNSDKLWSLVQSWRQSQGLAPYTKDQRLCKIAEDRVSDPQPDYHKGFIEKVTNGTYNSIVPGGTSMQENTVWNYPTEQSSLNGWLGSSEHLATLKKSYAYSCIACHSHVCDQIFSNF